MQMTYDQQNYVVQTAQSPGYGVILDLLHKRIEGLEAEMQMRQPTVEADLRVLSMWRGYKEALTYLTELPRIIVSQLEKDAQTGAAGEIYSGMLQPGLFGTADSGDIYGVAEQLKASMPPRYPPPMHPNQLFR